MIYYIVKPVNSVSQAQLNASGCRRVENTRLNQDKTKCIIKFSDEDKQHFMNEEWLTLSEIRDVLLQDEWVLSPEEEAGFFSAIASFFGF